jgi:hypothetical protein
MRPSPRQASVVAVQPSPQEPGKSVAWQEFAKSEYSWIPSHG